MVALTYVQRDIVYLCFSFTIYLARFVVVRLLVIFKIVDTD